MLRITGAGKPGVGKRNRPALPASDWRDTPDRGNQIGTVVIYTQRTQSSMNLKAEREAKGEWLMMHTHLDGASHFLCIVSRGYDWTWAVHVMGIIQLHFEYFMTSQSESTVGAIVTESDSEFRFDRRYNTLLSVQWVLCLLYILLCIMMTNWFCDVATMK